MTEAAATPALTGPISLVIFGRQGSGKGTQCAHLVERYGCVHISTGDMLRAAVAAETELGLQAKAVMDSGGLVSDDIMIGIVGERLAEDDVTAGGFLLDGFPRTPNQAEALAGIAADLGLTIAAAINLDVPVDEVTERMMARGREDDTEEAIRTRLGLYEEQTAPLIDWFDERELLTVVDGLGTEDEVRERLAAAVDDRSNATNNGTGDVDAESDAT